MYVSKPLKTIYDKNILNNQLIKLTKYNKCFNGEEFITCNDDCYFKVFNYGDGYIFKGDNDNYYIGINPKNYK